MVRDPLTPRLTFSRYPDAITAQATALAEHLIGADLTVDVPTCPEWNLAQLTHHVGEEFRWLERIVRTRATVMPDDSAMRALSRTTDRDGAATGEWIVAGAEALAHALREAGPEATMWAPLPGQGASFFARRFAHESAIHRADAALALNQSFAVSPDLALDAIAEWMELGALPRPEHVELLGAGQTIRVSAIDATGPDSTWLVDLTGESVEHRPGTIEPAAVEARGLLTDLLLVLYRRQHPDALTIDGDRVLFDFWHSRVGFG